VTLGLIAGIAAGLALAAIAGARRTSTAYARWRTATAAPDAIVFGSQLGIEDADYAPVLALPEVIDGGRFRLAPVGVTEHDELGSLAPGDDHLYQTVARPLLVHGRLPDPRRPDEVVVNRAAAAKYHLHVGQSLTLVSSTDPGAFYGQSPMPGGPTVRARIVGVGDSMMDQIFLSGVEPGFAPTPAFLAGPPQVPGAQNLVVRLRPGTDVTKFHERVAAAMKLPDIPVRDLGEDRKRITHSTGLERTGLLLFAAAVVLAGVVMVGQALTRSVHAMAEEASALRAIGFTRAALVRGMALPIVVTAVTAVVVAVGGAIAFSTRFPVGLARRLDPDVGAHADWLVLGLGAAALAVVIMAGAVVAAVRAAAGAARRGTMRTGSPIVRSLRAAAPLPLGIGAGLALEPGHGDRAVPVRPAIAGAVAGILGVVGALGLVHGIDDALATPARAGQLWDALVMPNEQHSIAELAAATRADHDIRAVTDLVRMPLDLDGAGIPVYSLNQVQGNVPFVVLHGRAPTGTGEVALGPASAKALHKHIGDRVRIRNADKGEVTARVVGTALLPQTPHSSFDQGAWVSWQQIRALADIDTGEIERGLAVVVRPGVNPEALGNRLQKQLGVEVDRFSDAPQDVLALHDVRSLPKALAAFLALLGVAAVAHALFTAVRRRRHDLAVLRAMGLRPRQSAAVVAWQGTIVAVIALVLGLPLGVVAGRLSWRQVADSTPLRYVPPIAGAAILVAIPVALLLANALAAWPGRQAARMRPAEVLRAE